MHERLTRQQQKAQTRQRLLDAAGQLFAERGIDAASLDDVAAAAGYTKGAVYSNFASKTDLVIALLERRIASQTAVLSARFGGRSLAAIGEEELASFDEPPEDELRMVLLVVEFWRHAMRDPRARRLVAGEYEAARTVVASYLEQAGYGSGVASAGLSARDLAIVIEAIGTGLGMQAALDPDNVRTDLMPRVLTLLLGALTAGEPERPPA
jgi:AcrR family transcriptional regulator